MEIKETSKEDAMCFASAYHYSKIMPQINKFYLGAFEGGELKGVVILSLVTQPLGTIRKEICFTQETTLSGKKTLNTIKTAIKKDYYIRLYYVGLDTKEESLPRIANRVKNAGTILIQNNRSAYVANINPSGRKHSLHCFFVSSY